VKLRTKLMNLAKAVADQAERDPEFAARLTEIVDADAAPKAKAGARPKNRRTPAVLDPVAVARQGEPVLRERLAALSFEQLRDIVADYGMDPGKLVMKWKPNL
jgi:hydroxymethylpyrimidine/phosphomethylpyrimidine kinase